MTLTHLISDEWGESCEEVYFQDYLDNLHRQEMEEIFREEVEHLLKEEENVL